MEVRLFALLPMLLLAALACGGQDQYAAGDPSESPPGSSPGPSIPSTAGTWQTDWSRRSIELNELIVGIGAGVDSRDLIPPLDDPSFESSAQADAWLEDREPVLLLELGGEARAYPLRILMWHEIVNDTVGGQDVVITFCPLCNSAVVFDRRLDGLRLRFGTSGLLRKSDLVMWDDATESLWQQLTGEAIVGEFTGERLRSLPATLIRWTEFLDRFPEGKVLSMETGFTRQYGANPYVYYDGTSQPFLFVGDLDSRYPAMERVVAVTVDGESKAYPFSAASQEGAINDELAGMPLVVFWGAADTASALDDPTIARGRAVGVGVAYGRRVAGRLLTFEATGEDRFTDGETGSEWDLLGNAVSGPLSGLRLPPVVHANHFWFAWAAFNPDAPVYEPKP